MHDNPESMLSGCIFLLSRVERSDPMAIDAPAAQMNTLRAGDLENNVEKIRTNIL